MASLEIERLDKLISQVLNSSLLEGGKMIVDREKTDLVKLVHELLQVMKIRFTEAGATISLKKTMTNYLQILIAYICRVYW